MLVALQLGVWKVPGAFLDTETGNADRTAWLSLVLQLMPVAERSAVAHLLGLQVRVPPGTWMFVLCVVGKNKKTKCRTIKTKTQIRMKYRVQENTKKSPAGDVVVCCQVEVSATGRSLV